MVNKYHLVILAVIIIVTLGITTSNKKQKVVSNSAYGSVPAVKPSTSSKPSSKQNDKQQNKDEKTKTKNATPSVSTTKTIKQTKQTQKKIISKTSSKSTQTPNKADQQTKTSEEKEVTTFSAYSGDNAKEEEAIHSFWVTFFSYLLLFIVLGIGYIYVYMPNTSFYELFIDIMIVIASSLKSKSKIGYKPSQDQEEVDDSNSITVGYTQDHGKQLFWQKNSVQGI